MSQPLRKKTSPQSRDASKKSNALHVHTGSVETPPSNNKINIILVIILTAAVAFGVFTAIRDRWVCDDAFISYRYAENLVHGKGLVFNAGERVEGYTNFLWTLWCAVPLLLGLQCENWSMNWGIFFYAASLALLTYHFFLVRRVVPHAAVALPLALILGAVHEDWSIFATSGLETSLFTFLGLTGYILLARGVVTGQYRPVMTGIVMTLAALTRPDGVIFGVVGGACLLWLTLPRWKPAILYALAFGLPHALFIAWRISYYGDFFPNTYYAKSGNLAWWSQGFHYLDLYLQKYGALIASLGALALCLVTKRKNGSADTSQFIIRRLALIAGAFGITYALFITRVGGDFMFARMLIPATPFFLILMELGMMRLPVQYLLLNAMLTAIAAVAIILPEAPMSNNALIHGVANEWSYYGDSLLHETQSETIKKYFHDLPVRIVFLGSEAHTMYGAKFPIAIESEAGLTDRTIAHQTLTTRGRIGHEKNARPEYVLDERDAHFTFHGDAFNVLRLEPYIPPVVIEFEGIKAFILHWDPEIMKTLKDRGVTVPDVPAMLDHSISQLDKRPDAEVAKLYNQLCRFYFNRANDPARQAAFQRRLSEKHPEIPSKVKI